MNILVASNNLKTTGLGTFIYTQVSELILRGHNVDVVTSHNGKVGERLSSNVVELDKVKKSYDLILTHQNDITFELINRNVSGYVIFTVHGLVYENDIPNEHLLHYVDNVFCVSQAIQNFLIIKKNINPLLIFQPVDCERFSPKNMLREKNIKVLSMVRGELHNMIRCACEILDYEYIGWQKPVEYYFHSHDEDDVIFNVEDRINEADIVIGLGRIIYESLSCGRNALVFDDREYQGNLGDGMVTPDNIDNLIMNNFSGRYNNKSFSLEDLVEELKKYDPTYSNFFRNHIKTNFNVKDLIDQYLESISIPMKAYMIYVESSDRSVDCAKKSQKVAKEVGGIDVELWPGVDKYNVWLELEKKGIEISQVGQSYIGSGYLNCEIASALSHLSLWEESVKTNQRILVLEHDAVFYKKFVDYQFDGVLNLGKPNWGVRNWENESAGVHIRNHCNNPHKIWDEHDTEYCQCETLCLYGAHGYIISPSASKKLIESAYKDGIYVGDRFIRTEIVNIADQLPHRVKQESDFTLLQKPENTKLLSADDAWNN